MIPALNRDGDCLSDLVMPMFGSIAGAESVLLAFDDDYRTTVAMAEAPHGTAPALEGKDVANPMAMILACGAVLHYAADRGDAGAERASRAIYESVLEATAGGVRTPDLGGHAGDHRVHRRRHRARAHEDRRLVVAGLDGLAARALRAATSCAPVPAAPAVVELALRRTASATPASRIAADVERRAARASRAHGVPVPVGRATRRRSRPPGSS